MAAPNLPPETERLWTEMYNEVMWLHARWRIYGQLFGTSPEHIELLNRAAAMTFGVFQRALLMDVEMALAKLNDPANGGRNASLKTLRNKIAALADSQFTRDLDCLVAKYADSVKNIEMRRNKSHAHYDYRTLIGVQPLPPSLLSEIEQALDALQRFMHAIESRFFDSDTKYAAVKSISDGDRLLEVLSHGLAREEDSHRLPEG